MRTDGAADEEEKAWLPTDREHAALRDRDAHLRLTEGLWSEHTQLSRRGIELVGSPEAQAMLLARGG